MAATGNWSGGIMLDGGGYNIVDGNKVHDNPYVGISGIKICDSSFNKVTNNESYHNNQGGIVVCGSSTDNDVGFNKSHDNTLSPGDSDGISLSYPSTRTNLHDNLVYGNSDDGIDTWDSPGNFIIHNIVHDQNGIGDGNGIKLGDGATGGNNLIRQNISYNNKATGFTSNRSGGNTYYNNVAYNNNYGFDDGATQPSMAQNTYINNIGYNNVIANFSASIYATVSHNNIWYSDGSGPKVMYEYNAYATLSAFFLATGLDNPDGDLASLQVAPQFVNPAGGLFDLLPSSPAIDHGDPGNPGQVIAVNRVDIGAIEYGSSLSPTVTSIVRANPDPTNLASVDFTVTFSESVTGVDASDFALMTTDVSGATISGVSGSNSTYTVIVNTGNANGTIRLDVVDDDTIMDTSGNRLNGGYTSGETYTITKEFTLTIVSANGSVAKNPDQTTYHEGDVVQLTATPNAGWNFANWSGDLTSSVNPDSITIHGNDSVIANYTQLLILTLNSKSAAANDGWVLESSETSNTGGTLNATTSTFNLGDDKANKQYRGILHFDTSALPDTAVITSVKLKIRKQGLVGTDPFITHGGLLVDIQKPYFGTTAGLVIGDFQATSGQSVIATFDATPVSNWYGAIMNSAGYPYVNLSGTTQFRLRFTSDDNNDLDADYMKFYSGDASTANRPQLIIQYYIP